MKVTIIGGGNIGTLMAAEFSHRGHTITVYTPRVKEWNNKIKVNCNIQSNSYIAEIALATDDLERAIENADYIFITLPAMVLQDFCETIKKYVKPNQKIGMIPGCGGIEFILQELINKQCIIFGFQRVHAISRLEQYGHSVNELGRKTQMQVGCIPNKHVNAISNDMESLFDMDCLALDSYLCVTLTPTNPILHTARLYSLFNKCDVYEQNVLFYKSWNNDSSETLLECDMELQNICTELDKMDLTSVKSLQVHYDSFSAQDMTAKLSSISSFQNIKSPMKQVDNGWIPDFTSRYFLSDFPYGLCIIKSFAHILNINTPMIDKVLKWYAYICGKEYYVFDKFCGKDLAHLPLPQNHNLIDKECIYKFYKL